MKLSKSIFFATAICCAVSASAQTKKSTKPAAHKTTVKTKPTLTDEEVPIESLEDTKIDVPDVPTAKQALDTTAAPNDELTTEIKKLLDVSNAVALGVSATESLLEQQKAANTDKNMDAFYARFLETFKSVRVHGLLENIFVKVYRDAYTLDEVKQLTEFYKTPVGKKTLEALPVILQKSQNECRMLGVMLATEIYQQQAQGSNQ